MTIVVSEDYKRSSDFNFRELLVESLFSWLVTAGVAPNKNIARFTERGWHVPRRNLNNVCETFYFNWSNLVLSWSSAELALLVLTSCPDTAFYEKQSVLFTACYLLNLLISKLFQFGRLHNSIKTALIFILKSKLTLVSIATAEHSTIGRQEKAMPTTCAHIKQWIKGYSLRCWLILNCVSTHDAKCSIKSLSPRVSDTITAECNSVRVSNWNFHNIANAFNQCWNVDRSDVLWPYTQLLISVWAHSIHIAAFILARNKYSVVLTAADTCYLNVKAANFWNRVACAFNADSKLAVVVVWML